MQPKWQSRERGKCVWCLPKSHFHEVESCFKYYKEEDDRDELKETPFADFVPVVMRTIDEKMPDRVKDNTDGNDAGSRNGVDEVRVHTNPSHNSEKSKFNKIIS